MCCGCFPSGCADVGELLSEPWFPAACCIPKWTLITCRNSRINKREFTVDEERCYKSEKPNNSNEAYGNPALYPHFCLPVSP